MSETTLFIAENPSEKAGAGQLIIGLDDLVLTQDMPTSAGSKMLAGFKSLFAARVDERLREAGHHVAGKVNIGEFGFDFLGETSYFGPVVDANGNLTTAASKLLADAAVDAVVGLDVNGAQARAAALSDQVHLKPTYGGVSRFGTIAVACSGETVDITACSADVAQQVLDVLAGHDDSDGTSLPASECARITSSGSAEAATAGEAFASPITHVKVARGLIETADADTKQLMEDTISALSAQGITVSDTTAETDALFAVGNLAWNILMCAELCNNENRFEGMKYGYHTQKYTTIGELYTKSRTEAFGILTKTAVLSRKLSASSPRPPSSTAPRCLPRTTTIAATTRPSASAASFPRHLRRSLRMKTRGKLWFSSPLVPSVRTASPTWRRTRISRSRKTVSPLLLQSPVCRPLLQAACNW